MQGALGYCWLGLVLAAGLTAGCSPDETPPGLPVQAQNNIAYVTRGTTSLKLDLAAPKDGGPYPAVILLHGGAWTVGDRSDLSRPGKDKSGARTPSVIEQIATHGYVVASVSYRLAPKSKFPAQLADVRTAIRFLRANAKTYSIDPEQFAVGGFSAGGHLALLAGLADKSPEFDGPDLPEQSSKVKCVLSYFGPTDLSLYAASEGLEEAYMFPLLGKECRTDAEIYRRASPIQHVSRDDPPVMMIHGTADLIVPIIHSERLLEKLQANGVTAELITMKGEGHGAWRPSVSAKSTREAIRFLDHHLKGKK
jgi:acetyl esterase/lipase